MFAFLSLIPFLFQEIFPADMDRSWLEPGEYDSLRDATGKVSEALAALIGHMKRGVAGGQVQCVSSGLFSRFKIKKF